MTFEQSLEKIEGTLRSYVAEVDRLQEDKRRLRAENAELLAAAKASLDYLARGKVDRVDTVLRAAIAKAEESEP